MISPLRVSTAPEPSPGAAPPASRSDDALVGDVRSGDRNALSLLLDRHYDRIHRVVWRMLGSQSDADDVTQDVCCSIVERLASFRGEAKFSTWAVGIAINAARDFQRRARSLQKLRAGLSSTLLAAAPNDGRDLYRQSWLASELSRLDPKVRAAAILIAGEDFTHAEAAAALSVAESTVSGWMHEAKRKLGSKSKKDLTDDV